MTEPNRAPSTVWSLRRDMGCGYVCTMDDDKVAIFVPSDSGYVAGIRVSRKDARLIAKRINECLDATVKR